MVRFGSFSSFSCFRAVRLLSFSCAVVVAGASSIGCDDGDVGTIDGGVDGGSTPDGGEVRDAGDVVDSGGNTDGGTDAGAPDADAGSPDAGEDAGNDVDAGSDGGTGVDAGSNDAGADVDAGGDSGPAVDSGPRWDGGRPTYAQCFSDIISASRPGPDYDQYGPVVDVDCTGTDHQAIEGVERVVFLGDSISVGTPPTQSGDFYRSRMADTLGARFGLTAPSDNWKRADFFNGMSGVQDSGDFSSCAEWGARNDDLRQDGTQVEDCLPVGERDKRTLVVFTMGGNDVANLARRGSDPNVTEADLYLQINNFVALLDDTLTWIYEPGRFPNGVFVVFGNLYEYTDATGDLLSCPAASTAGLDTPWEDPALLDSLITFANEEYMRIAVEHQADMIFMLENFCGHGYRNDDDTLACYRGPEAERWFDVSCIHPTPRGHEQIANLFLDVIE